MLVQVEGIKLGVVEAVTDQEVLPCHVSSGPEVSEYGKVEIGEAHGEVGFLVVFGDLGGEVGVRVGLRHEVELLAREDREVERVVFAVRFLDVELYASLEAMLGVLVDVAFLVLGARDDNPTGGVVEEPVLVVLVTVVGADDVLVGFGGHGGFLSGVF